VTNWNVQSVYRAVGYRSSSVVGLPFDDRAAGLIGHTKSDAAETVSHLLAETTPTATAREPEAVDAFLLERGVAVADLDHWLRLDQHEIALGEASGRVRVKVAGRDEMLDAGR
jgi:ferredoxin--NADP+ reductase